MNLTRSLSATLVAAAIVALATTGCTAAPTAPTHTRVTPSATAHAGPALPPDLSTSQIAALPAAEYNAVIPGLLPAPQPVRFTGAYRVTFDAPLYADDFRTAVARIPAKDFLDAPTVVVPIQTRGSWSLVLTPARQKLPSTATGDAPAPAQTAAWLPTRALTRVAALTQRVVISTASQTLSVTDAAGTAKQTFPVGVGTDSTPTPTGTTGYLQARYLDPAQGQTDHRIQLTSLHATAADEPYGGADGGLIGIHFQSTSTGAVSHGCVRLSAEAIAVIDKLPLGTPVQIID
jgi:lipoprotein-anchoring transpeptidase ErfK/SrfK